MENKNKNLIIGALLAVVLLMVVGYAAFAQTLTINGSAKITSTWAVEFDRSKTSGADVISTNTGFAGGTAPTGQINYTDVHNATISANLYQPGDTVTFTLTIVNNGNITAALENPVVTMDGDEDGSGNLTATKGNIKFTVTAPNPATIGEDDTATMTVKAEFIGTAESVGTTTSASVNITTQASQA